jgi:uncharacterized protein YoxC
VIAISIAYFVIRSSRVIDEAKALVREVTTTVNLINSPLKSIQKVSKRVEDLSEKVSSAGEEFFEDNPIALKAAGALFSAAKMRGKKRKANKKKSA